MRHAKQSARGHTLTELLVSLAITALMMTGVAGAVIGLSRSFESNARTREAVPGRGEAPSRTSRKGAPS